MSIRRALTVWDSILMELVWLRVLMIWRSIFGISGHKGLSNATTCMRMHLVAMISRVMGRITKIRITLRAKLTLRASVSTQTVATFSQLPPTHQSKFGICAKATFCTPSTGTSAAQTIASFRHQVITFRRVETIPSWWSGSRISMSSKRKLLTILVGKLLCCRMPWLIWIMLKMLCRLQLLRRDHRLQVLIKFNQYKIQRKKSPPCNNNIRLQISHMWTLPRSRIWSKHKNQRLPSSMLLPSTRTACKAQVKSWLRPWRK